MLLLIGHVLLHPLFLIDLPLIHHIEEGARRDGDGDGIAGFGLQQGVEKKAQLVNKTKKTNAQEEATTQTYRRQLHVNVNVRRSANYARVAVFVFSSCRKKLWPPPSLARRRCLRIARRLVGCRSCF